MTEENHTIRLLTKMHAEIQQAREEMQQTREEMRSEFANVRQEMKEGFEVAREERAALRQRMVEGEIRVSTELLAVGGALDEVKGLVRQQAAIKMVVTDHERRIRKLEGD